MIVTGPPLADAFTSSTRFNRNLIRIIDISLRCIFDLFVFLLIAMNVSRAD
jgi:hypothetical protein